MIVSLEKDSVNGEYVVWVAMVDGDATTQHESFVIGIGEDPAEAFAKARVALDKAFDDLVVLAHDQGVVIAR